MTLLGRTAPGNDEAPVLAHEGPSGDGSGLTRAALHEVDLQVFGDHELEEALAALEATVRAGVIEGDALVARALEHARDVEAVRDGSL